MNDRNPLAVLLVIGAAFTGLLIMTSILLGAGNQIAALCKYLLVAVFIVGFAFPRGSFVLWLVLCGYTDLVKRLMVVSGRISYNDLYYVLGIPPVMIGAIVLSVLSGTVTGRFRLQKNHWTLFMLSCVLVVASAALAAKEGGSLGAIAPAVANQGLYAFLIFLVPVLYQTSEDVINLLRNILWIFLPVGLYGIFQQWHGFQEFEIDYLKSGMSIEIKQLVFNEVRAFSTLNSPTALAVVSTTLCALSLVLWWLPRDQDGRRTMNWGTALLLAAVYFGSYVASTGRAGIVVFVFGLMGFLCFPSRGLTKALYAILGAAFILLVFTADTLLNNLGAFQDKITNAVGDGQFADQMTRVGTYSDRLMGYSNLVKNPEVYTLFGHGARAGEDSTLYSHDLLTAAIIKYGMVLTTLALMMLAYALIKAHGQVLRIGDPYRRKLAAAMLAFAMSYVVLSVLAGSVLAVFPVNAFGFFFCGLLMLIAQHDREHAVQTETETEPAPAGVIPSPVPAFPTHEPARVVNRFRQSGRLPSNY